MKISRSIRDSYELQRAIATRLESSVGNFITARIPRTWHFESRIKSEVSFAQKLETGMFDIDSLEDFFACTIVVPTLYLTETAENIVNDIFEIVRRKPENNIFSDSAPTNFLFDHTRIYAKLKPALGIGMQPINEVQFEIQIKTFLQHAWSIATHDLTYKTSKVSWGKERIAAQLKASLEAAEVSILEAEVLSSSGNMFLSRQDSATIELLSVIESIQAEFEAESLPDDLKRLGQSVRSLLLTCNLTAADLPRILENGRNARTGGHPMNLSPYSTVVQYLLMFELSGIENALKKGSDRRVLLVPEIEIPDHLNSDDLPGAILL